LRRPRRVGSGQAPANEVGIGVEVGLGLIDGGVRLGQIAFGLPYGGLPRLRIETAEEIAGLYRLALRDVHSINDAGRLG
jgi:hypothetical protein